MMPGSAAEVLLSANYNCRTMNLTRTLLQVAHVGLTKAVKNYQAGSVVGFATYA